MPMTMGDDVVYNGMEMDGQMMGGGPYFDGMNSGSDCETCQNQGNFSGMMGSQMKYGQPMMYGDQQSTMMPTPAYQMDAPAPPSANPTPARSMAPYDPNAKEEYLAPRVGPQSNMYYRNGMQSYSGMMPQQQMMMQPQMMMPQQMMQPQMMPGGMVQGNMMQGNVMQTSGMMTPQMMPQQVPQQMMQPMQYQPQSQMQQQMNFPVQQAAGVPAIQAF
ncbi:hypothetical protein [Planctomicrobium sp. SH527]|uniref:hypothetical protein n=1 Tax=Planctomicrobium sp. SH527 TaxID=3448123 RepID=UPI003F5C5A6F